MSSSKLNLIWANKPGCSLAVAEIWIGRDQLWFTIFFDEEDNQIKIEILPPFGNATAKVVNISDAERLIETAKREMLAMSEAKAGRTISEGARGSDTMNYAPRGSD